MLVRQPSRWGRVAVLAPALTVAAAAVAATAHGGYEVAVACAVPPAIAWLYPLITDGLALVAYAATHRLRARSALIYAWSVVVLAAALSGLAQAVYLASGPALDTSPVLRFGVGAWPAIAGAVAAHLVYLLARTPALVPPAPGALSVHANSTQSTRPGAPTPLPLPAGPVLVEPGSATPPARITSPAARRQPTSRASVGDLADLAEKARPLVAKGFGRGRLATALGVKPDAARQVIDHLKATSS